MKDNKKQKKILEVAEEEFLMKGFAGARTVEIAQKAGVSHSMLHYYYKTKEQLFEHVMGEKLQQLKESVATVFMIEDMPVVEKVVELVVRHFDFLSENPDLPRFIINEVIVRPEYAEMMKREALPILKDAVARFQCELDAAAKEGEVRTMDAATLLMDIVSLNFFSFIVAPILSSVKPGMDLQAYYHARCQENVQLILNRINPDIK